MRSSWKQFGPLRQQPLPHTGTVPARIERRHTNGGRGSRVESRDARTPTRPPGHEYGSNGNGRRPGSVRRRRAAAQAAAATSRVATGKGKRWSSYCPLLPGFSQPLSLLLKLRFIVGCWTRKAAAPRKTTTAPTEASFNNGYQKAVAVVAVVLQQWVPHLLFCCCCRCCVISMCKCQRNEKQR